MGETGRTIIEFILCFFLPPLAVYLHANDCNVHVIVTCVLCLLVWVPAVVYSIVYVCCC